MEVKVNICVSVTGLRREANSNFTICYQANQLHIKHHAGRDTVISQFNKLSLILDAWHL